MTGDAGKHHEFAEPEEDRAIVLEDLPPIKPVPRPPSIPAQPPQPSPDADTA